MNDIVEIVRIVREIENNMGLHFVSEVDEKERKIVLLCDHQNYIMCEFLYRLLVRLCRDVLGVEVSCGDECDP